MSTPRSQHRRGELGEGEGNSVKVTKGEGGFRSGAHAALRTLCHGPAAEDDLCALLPRLISALHLCLLQQ